MATIRRSGSPLRKTNVVSTTLPDDKERAAFYAMLEQLGTNRYQYLRALIRKDMKERGVTGRTIPRQR